MNDPVDNPMQAYIIRWYGIPSIACIDESLLRRARYGRRAVCGVLIKGIKRIERQVALHSFLHAHQTPHTVSPNNSVSHSSPNIIGLLDKIYTQKVGIQGISGSLIWR